MDQFIGLEALSNLCTIDHMFEMQDQQQFWDYYFFLIKWNEF